MKHKNGKLLSCMTLAVLGGLASGGAAARVTLLDGLHGANETLSLLRDQSCNLSIKSETEQVDGYTVTTQGYPDCSRWLMSVSGFSLATVEFTSPGEKTAARRLLLDYVKKNGGTDAQRESQDLDEARKQVGSNPLATWALNMQQNKPDSEGAYEQGKSVLPAIQKNCPDTIVVRTVPVDARYGTTGMEGVAVVSSQCHIMARYTINTGEVTATQDDTEVNGEIHACGAGVYYGRVQCWNGTSESKPAPLGMR